MNDKEKFPEVVRIDREEKTKVELYLAGDRDTEYTIEMNLLDLSSKILKALQATGVLQQQESSDCSELRFLSSQELWLIAKKQKGLQVCCNTIQVAYQSSWLIILIKKNGFSSRNAIYLAAFKKSGGKYNLSGLTTGLMDWEGTISVKNIGAYTINDPCWPYPALNYFGPGRQELLDLLRADDCNPLTIITRSGQPWSGLGQQIINPLQTIARSIIEQQSL